jgi:hypothetical protein
MDKFRIDAEGRIRYGEGGVYGLAEMSEWLLEKQDHQTTGPQPVMDWTRFRVTFICPPKSRLEQWLHYLWFHTACWADQVWKAMYD